MKHPYKTALLVIGDIIALYVALIATLLVRYGSLANAPLVTEHFTTFSIVFVLWLVVFFIHNLYDFTAAKNTLEFFTTVYRALFVNAVIALGFFYLIPYFSIAPKRNLFIFLVIFTVLFALWRNGANQLFKIRLHIPTLLMGTDERVAPLAEELNQNPQIGHRVIGVFTDKLPPENKTRSFLTYTHSDFLNLKQIVREYKIEAIIVEGDILSSKEVIKQLDSLIGRDIAIVDFNSFKERLIRKIDLATIDELWFFKYAATGKNITYDTLKRIVDIITVLIFALPALILSILVSIGIKIQDGEYLLIRQPRTGQGGKPFTLLKFRSMVMDAEKRSQNLTQKNDPRITSFGGFIRKTRLDELPQFINILKGDMSFVGPRSEQPTIDKEYTQKVPFYQRRYLLKPGVTGWAQINYGYVSTINDVKERLAYDLFYLKNRSLLFDVGIILKTIDRLLRGVGR